MLKLMAEKNQYLQQILAETTKTSAPVTTAGVEIMPEQLWADSLVPQLRRIDPDIRDEFMLYVMAQTLKAIRGQWPNNN